MVFTFALDGQVYNAQERMEGKEGSEERPRMIQKDGVRETMTWCSLLEDGSTVEKSQFKRNYLPQL